MVKHLVSCGIAFIALAVSGWSNASTLDIPELCGEFDILNDPENRVYRGELKWKRDTLETALVVTPVTRSGATVVFYVWGEQPKWKIKEAGCVPAAAYQKGDTMTLHMRGTKVRATYKFSGDEASVKYKQGGRTTKGKVTLSDMTVSATTTPTAQQADVQVPTHATSADEPPQSGIAAITGEWVGTWSGGGSRSTLKVVAENEMLQVRYCYGGDCRKGCTGTNCPTRGKLRDVTFEDGRLTFRWNKVGFVFQREGAVLKGVFRDRATVRMKRKK